MVFKDRVKVYGCNKNVSFPREDGSHDKILIFQKWGGGGLRYPSGLDIQSRQAYHEFEPSTTKVTPMTPELAPTSSNYHTTPTGGRFSPPQI
ncbi:hypothetical protein TNCV_4210361 [Trichonephila clavipes]|nr:hypothetical protein TNCV_4210361 [Trichonephila clavipes]